MKPLARTEERNPKSMNMDRMSSEEMTRLVITANYEAVKAVEDAAVPITRAVDAIAEAFENGHRLFYVGAGTSGRLGIIDAAECPPTFGVPHGQVTGIIAGGADRVFKAGESEEDCYEGGCRVIAEYGVEKGDVVVGISAAGNAAFVIGAMETAKALGCVVIGLSSNSDTGVLKVADIPIFTDTGAEVLTGSTRLKAGTAQKIVLNTLTTCAMTKTGKVYENMMINLEPSNEKLRGRVIRIVSEILNCPAQDAEEKLSRNEWNIRRTLDDAQRI